MGFTVIFHSRLIGVYTLIFYCGLEQQFELMTRSLELIDLAPLTSKYANSYMNPRHEVDNQRICNEGLDVLHPLDVRRVGL